MLESIPEHPSIPLLSKTKPKRRCNYVCSIICIVMISSILYFLFTGHGPYNSPSSSNPMSARYVAEVDEKKNSKHREYPANVIEINYNAQDLISFAGNTGPILPNSPLWHQFHQEMIIKAGYDPKTIKADPQTIVNFHAHDDDIYVADMNIDIIQLNSNDDEDAADDAITRKGREGGKGGRSPKTKPVIGPEGMHCYTSFMFLDLCEFGDSAECQAWYEEGADRWAHCGHHDEPGFVDDRGHPYQKIFGDDRTGCMGIWSDSDSSGGVYSGSRGSVYPGEDIRSIEQRPGLTTYYYDLGCEAWREDNEYMGIGARCCILPRPGDVYFKSYDTQFVGGGSENTKDYHTLWFGGNTGGRCPVTDCHEESGEHDIALGCAGGEGSGWSKATYSREYGGQKQTGNVCHTQRNDDEYINSYAICGNVYGGDISCMQIYSDIAEYQMDDVYYSTTGCPTDYAMTDCNGYINQQIDECSGDPFSTVDVVYGEMTSGDKCVAVGNSDKVRSQANCCRIQY